jgi:hypothetical protein
LFEILPESTETCIILDPFTRRSDERFFNPTSWMLPGIGSKKKVKSVIPWLGYGSKAYDPTT